jgi:hypothetical protein
MLRSSRPFAKPRPTIRKAVVAVRSPFARSAVSNGGRVFLEADVGNGPVARRMRDLIAEICCDISPTGVQDLSEGQRQLVRRAATLSVQCEVIECAVAKGERVDMDAYGVMCDRLGRTFNRLGLKRVRKEDQVPDLQEYLASLPATDEEEAA